MLHNCIICKENFQVGQIAPENWTICIECVEKGYMVCESDRKIFNKKKKIENNYTIDNLQTLIIGNYDLLEDVTRSFEYMKHEEKVCSSKCFNILYLNKCIEELQAQLNMMFMEENITTFKSIIDNKEKRENFKLIVNNKINELEKCKQNYL